MTEDELTVLQSASALYRRSDIGFQQGPVAGMLLADLDVLQAILMLAEAAPAMLAEIAQRGGLEVQEVTLQ